MSGSAPGAAPGAASVAVPVRPSHGVPLLPGLSAVVGTGLVTWWVIGNHDTGEDHLIGPFALPAWVEPAADVFGPALLVLALSAIGVPGLRRGPGLSVWTVALLSVDAAFSAASWRVLTAGVVGANIGGGLLAMVGPCVFSSLLAPAAFIEVRRRGGLDSGLAPLPVLAGLLGPGFLILLRLTG